MSRTVNGTVLVKEGSDATLLFSTSGKGDHTNDFSVILKFNGTKWQLIAMIRFITGWWYINGISVIGSLTTGLLQIENVP